MNVYIKNNIGNHFVEFENLFDKNLYNNVGTTWEDYLEGKWVLLSQEQTQFYRDNPKASVKEVWDMELLPSPGTTLEEVIAEKINQINEYDSSSNVNEFFINGTLKAWFTPEQRSNYKSSIEAAKLVNINSVSLFIEDTLITLSISQAELMLAQIQLYADSCFIVTKNHKLQVESLKTIEEVNNYNYTTGYPEKLNLTIDLNN